MIKRLPLIVARQLQANAIGALRALSALATNQEKWDLYAGVLVERLPVITKEFNDIEKEFQKYLWSVEFEKSLKSKHELKHERELKQAELLKKGQLDADLDETISKQTAQDLKDAYTEEINKFQLAPRLTADDKAKNLASTNRHLDDTLYLLVEQKLGSQNHFLLPQGIRLDGETMRQAAERILKEKCGPQMNVQFYGNAPCGFYKYKYPESLRDQSVGAKVFFFRASLKNGNVDKSSSQKYEWLEGKTFTGKLHNSSYAQSVQKLLF